MNDIAPYQAAVAETLWSATEHCLHPWRGHDNQSGCEDREHWLFQHRPWHMSTSGKKKTCSHWPWHQLSPSKLQWSHSSRNEQVVCTSTQEAHRVVMFLLNPKLHRCLQKFQPVSLGLSSVLSTYYLQFFGGFLLLWHHCAHEPLTHWQRGQRASPTSWGQSYPALFQSVKRQMLPCCHHTSEDLNPKSLWVITPWRLCLFSV